MIKFIKTPRFQKDLKAKILKIELDIDSYTFRCEESEKIIRNSL
jgi:hypothetical protein